MAFPGRYRPLCARWRCFLRWALLMALLPLPVSRHACPQISASPTYVQESPSACDRICTYSAFPTSTENTFEQRRVSSADTLPSQGRPYAVLQAFVSPILPLLALFPLYLSLQM